LATGIFNSGANIGAILAPLTVPYIAEKYGWQMAFILTGVIGFVWIIFWIILYEIPSRKKNLSKAEFDYIHSDKEEESLLQHILADSIAWVELLKLKPTWAFIAGKFLADPVWWFCLFWRPASLKAEYQLGGSEIALPVALVYTMASVGSVYGGWLPMRFIKR